MIFNKKFNATDVCQILQACATLKVSELSVGDLKISFQATVLTKSPTIGSPFNHSPPTSVGDASSIEFDPTEERELREDQLAMMQIEDPLMYEKLLANGELEENGEETARDR